MLLNTAAAIATEDAPKIPHNVVARKSAAVARAMSAISRASPCLAISRATSVGIGCVSPSSDMPPPPFVICSYYPNCIARVKQYRVVRMRFGHCVNRYEGFRTKRCQRNTLSRCAKPIRREPISRSSKISSNSSWGNSRAFRLARICAGRCCWRRRASGRCSRSCC
jgi:hypothetical protein